MKLHLGVIDIPYSDEDKESKTTGSVAEYLEERYDILQSFFKMNEKRICDLLADDAAGMLENILAGAPASDSSFSESASKIHDMFVMFLTSQSLNGQPGVPTLRALMGIRTRLKGKRGPPRESFIDTGLYMASMRAWVSEIKNA